MTDLPMMLFRSGTEVLWDGRSYDTLTVETADDLADARAAGWLEAAAVTLLDNPPADMLAPRRGRPPKLAAA